LKCASAMSSMSRSCRRARRAGGRRWSLATSVPRGEGGVGGGEEGGGEGEEEGGRGSASCSPTSLATPSPTLVTVGCRRAVRVAVSVTVLACAGEGGGRVTL
jgi:hypothetical protein